MEQDELLDKYKLFERLVKVESELFNLKESLKSKCERDYYCPVCDSCGEDGCCPVEKCMYPGIKSETVTELKEQNKELYDKMKTYEDMLQEWVTSTPTDSSGKFCPINQPQAFKTKRILEGTWDALGYREE